MAAVAVSPRPLVSGKLQGGSTGAANAHRNILALIGTSRVVPTSRGIPNLSPMPGTVRLLRCFRKSFRTALSRSQSIYGARQDVASPELGKRVMRPFIFVRHRFSGEGGSTALRKVDWPAMAPLLRQKNWPVGRPTQRVQGAGLRINVVSFSAMRRGGLTAKCPVPAGSVCHDKRLPAITRYLPKRQVQMNSNWPCTAVLE